MSTATITFKDEDNGTIRLDAVYEGGFDPQSHAHQHAYMLIKMMDSIAEKQDGTEEIVAQDAEAQAMQAAPVEQ